MIRPQLRYFKKEAGYACERESQITTADRKRSGSPVKIQNYLP